MSAKSAIDISSPPRSCSSDEGETNSVAKACARQSSPSGSECRLRNGRNISPALRSPAAQRNSFSAIAPPSCGTSAASGASRPPRAAAGTLSARCAATTVTSACGTTSHETRRSPTSGRSGSAAARGTAGVSW